MHIFSGRIGRLANIIGQILCLGVVFLVAFLLAYISIGSNLTPETVQSYTSPAGFSLLVKIISIVGLVFSLSLMARRFHDLGKSGWYSLTAFIPLVNIWTVFETLFAKGTNGPNQYGLASSSGLLKDILGMK